MTDFKCLAKCVKNRAKMCETCSDHTNKDCHLKSFCHCYEICKFDGDKQEEKNKAEAKVCKICCCVEEKCKCKSKSPRRKKCTCKISKSPEREICDLCCRLMKNCVCKDKKLKRPLGNLRPRMLCEDLPLYDEKSHLLGYIKKGSIIDEPFCNKSRDKVLKNSSKSDSEDLPSLQCEGVERACMASCRYAEGVRRESGEAQSVPRWTTKSAFDYSTTRATRSPMRTLQTSPTKQKPRKKSCPCGK